VRIREETQCANSTFSRRLKSTEAASAGIVAKAELNGVIDVFFMPAAADREDGMLFGSSGDV
jgi:hypothetical protein